MGERVFTLREKLRFHREIVSLVEAEVHKHDMTAEGAEESVRARVEERLRERYGETPLWLLIVELLIKLLPLLIDDVDDSDDSEADKPQRRRRRRRGEEETQADA